MTDLLIDNDGNVDLAPGPSLLYHQRDVVLAAKGWHRFAPVVGADAVNFLLDTTQAPLVSGVVRVECERVGLPPATVSVVGGQITVTTLPQ